MTEFNKSKLRKLDGGLLLIFTELVECGSAKTTADRLCLSPSAVSHALGRLRELFQDPLFVRLPHGLEPTSKARDLYEQTRQLLSHAEKLLDVERGFNPTQESRIFRVSAPEYVTAQIAAPLVRRWSREAPALYIQFQHLSMPAAITQLQRGEIDFALGRFESNVPAGLRRDLLYRDKFCVAARRSHPRIQGAITQQQYETEGHALAHASSELTSDERKSAPKMSAGVGVGQWLTALAIAGESDYVATCHRRLAQRFASRFRLQVLDPPFVPYDFEVVALSRDKPESAVLWALGQVREQFG